MKLVVHTEVDAFVATLEKATRAKWTRHLLLLAQYGKMLGMPHVKKITGTLSELRIRGNQEVRAFFCFENKRIFVLHAFVKKTQKIPEREIEKAEKRRKSLTVA